MKKVVIVGGGTAGWFAAAKLKKEHSDLDVTLIESPKIPIIGVGESVTPHVVFFLNSLGIEEHEWMKHTGAIYKFANKFVDWTGPGEFQYFGFNYPTDVNLLKHEHAHATSELDWLFDNNTVRTTDTLMQLLHKKQLSQFDQYFYSAFHYMQRNTSPFDGNEYLLNTAHSWAHHINAELASKFVRDRVALPLGVNHIVSGVKTVGVDNQQCITHLELEDDSKVTADLYVDATGFHGVLTTQLGWKYTQYKSNPINRAWVCQTDYADPEVEMTNCTLTIAEPHGWRFKLGLYHRIGNGYCFGSDYVSDQSALDHFDQQVSLKKTNPRLIKWTPSRLEKLGHGNTVAIGLNCGFIEPLEANVLYTIVVSIQLLSQTISQSPGATRLDFSGYNTMLTQSIDDIANFILVHYTLSPRTDTEFWTSMRELGRRECHEDLVYKKYHDKFNTMHAALQGLTLFPEYMWAQLAHAWKLNLDSWNKSKLSTLDLELTRMHYEHSENKNRLISQHSENNYQWLKQHVFDGLPFDGIPFLGSN
jgi:tryptophan halogenase